MKARSNIILIVLFGLLLWLPTFDEIFHIDRALAYDEKRMLADLPAPQFGANGLKNFIEAAQKCFDDHFGFRLRLLRWHNHCNDALFGNRIGSGVIVGDDGWLFYAQEDMVEQYRGVHQFAERDLLDWKCLLERRRDWLAARGARYIFVVAPDKQSVYSDKLPPWLAKVRTETKLDQFLAYMRAHSTVEVLDLRPALLEGRRIAPTYLKADTHWNQFASFLASREVIHALSADIPNLPTLELDSFDMRPKLGEGGGLAAMLGLDAAELPETSAMLLTPKSNMPPVETSPAGLTKNPKAKGEMMVFHDSFGVTMEPFLCYDFGTVIYRWRPYLDGGMIAREKPTVVLTEMVERFFDAGDPMKLMREDNLR